MTIFQRPAHPAPRAVFLINHYMGGIHAGIQAGHALSRLHMTHPLGCPSYPLIESWDQPDPWMFLYNGGFASHLEDSAVALESINRHLLANPHPSLPPGAGIPFARFHEGKNELNGAMTAVALIVPGEMVAEDDMGVVPEDFQALMASSSRNRTAAAMREDLPVEYRLNLLFHRLPYAL